MRRFVCACMCLLALSTSFASAKKSKDSVPEWAAWKVCTVSSVSKITYCVYVDVVHYFLEAKDSTLTSQDKVDIFLSRVSRSYGRQCREKGLNLIIKIDYAKKSITFLMSEPKISMTYNMSYVYTATTRM